MGNMLLTGQALLVKLAKGRDVIRLMTLMLAAYLSVGSTSVQSTTDSACCTLQAQHVSSGAWTAAFNDSPGFAPQVENISAPVIQQQEQQRWVF